VRLTGVALHRVSVTGELHHRRTTCRIPELVSTGVKSVGRRWFVAEPIYEATRVGWNPDCRAAVSMKHKCLCQSGFATEVAS
jgi:hypothetical protein